ncbi:MAG: GNAT family N-acetyltransferase [Planctomycetes bacterium]|nr:GNAT family N-acetyltransferase [Planctomycetota bacterium]
MATGNAIRIEPATDMAIVRTLFREYAVELGIDLSFQSFDNELASLPGKYAGPDGAILVAVTDREAAGVVALRRHDDTVAEMKRLYVRPEYRGTGTGRRLVEALIAAATERGYDAVVLDTLRTLTASVALYRRLGFRECLPHYHNPHPDALYLRLDLPGRSDG